MSSVDANKMIKKLFPHTNCQEPPSRKNKTVIKIINETCYSAYIYGSVSVVSSQYTDTDTSLVLASI
jgi:hypothetical protein